MRLSEAIRLGATMKPQFFGFYMGARNNKLSTCALGAALDAVGDLWGMAALHFSILDVPAQCPQCTYKAPRLEQVIAHLNDDHLWTREAIADWLELEIEPLPIESTDQHQDELLPEHV